LDGFRQWRFCWCLAEQLTRLTAAGRDQS